MPRKVTRKPRIQKAKPKQTRLPANPKQRKKPAKKTTKGVKIPQYLVYCGKTLYLVLNNKKISFPKRKTAKARPAALLSDARGRVLYVVRYDPKKKTKAVWSGPARTYESLAKQWALWSGSTDDTAYRFDNVDTDSVLGRVGSADEIAYQWVTDSADYYHPFDHPATVYANRSRSVYALKGRGMRITKKGIEG
ncbi:MAG: hypothetical protein QNJ97_25150 [Myxococcota bacterium]|nr:hypothetical protein [Myxococcota bacterium]